VNIATPQHDHAKPSTAGTLAAEALCAAERSSTLHDQTRWRRCMIDVDAAALYLMIRYVLLKVAYGHLAPANSRSTQVS
jgi:hypothetical protein